MGVSVLAGALVRWQHAAGPFWPYVCAAPFLGTGESADLLRGSRLPHAAMPVAAHASARPGMRAAPAVGLWTQQQRALADALLRTYPVADGLPASGSHPLSMLLLDLPVEPVLSIAPLLVAQGWYVVPVIQRWIGSPAVLPCRTLLLRLVAGAWRARRPAVPRGVVLIADGARQGPHGYPLLAPGRVFDNRYEYQICRFPSTDLLRAHRVRYVRWLTAPTLAAAASTVSTTAATAPAGMPAPLPVDLAGRPVGTVVARDLVAYQETLLQAGISVDVQPWRPAR